MCDMKRNVPNCSIPNRRSNTKKTTKRLPLYPKVCVRNRGPAGFGSTLSLHPSQRSCTARSHLPAVLLHTNNGYLIPNINNTIHPTIEIVVLLCARAQTDHFSVRPSARFLRTLSFHRRLLGACASASAAEQCAQREHRVRPTVAEFHLISL